MARYWKEQVPGTRLDPKWTYFVAVCGFTFRFRTLTQLGETLTFYRCKIHPSSRLPDAEWVECVRADFPADYREMIRRQIAAEHDVIQRWWERLPLYLQESGKRPRVVKALERAQSGFAAGA